MSQRVIKLQKLAMEVMGEEIQRLKDPRVGFVTVTAVRITSDLSQAKVFITIMGSEEEKRGSLAGLESATPHLRRVLGRELHVRHVPELTFVLDDVADKANRIEEILHQIHEQDGTAE